MNKQVLEEQWTEIKDFIRNQFPNLTDEDVRLVNGRYDQLITRIQQRYGYTKDQAEEEVKKWVVNKVPSSTYQDRPATRQIKENKQDDRQHEPSSKWALWAAIPLALLLGSLLGYNMAPKEVNVTETREAVFSTGSPQDQALRDRIRSSIIENQSLSAASNAIQITALNGIVTLTGSVATAEQRDAIERLIQNQNGVTRVNNELQIRR